VNSCTVKDPSQASFVNLVRKVSQRRQGVGVVGAVCIKGGPLLRVFRPLCRAIGQAC
jgi:hypothetical protein